MESVLHAVFLRTWWVWEGGERTGFSEVYHWFNVLEGCAWVVFAGLVLWRWWRRGRSGIELGYAGAFFTFGLTDFREAWEMSSWLIWLKLVNLIVLFCLRRLVMKRYYPEAKVY